MRLGDLDALKKEVENLVVGGAEGLKDYYENGSKADENSWIGGVYDAWELINNAPSIIEYVITSDGLPVTDLRSRPTGTWIDVPIKPDLVNPTGIDNKCPICERTNGYGQPPFCMYCGAQLEKSEGAKERKRRLDDYIAAKRAKEADNEIDN